jgi:hypothetical protein
MEKNNSATNRSNSSFTSQRERRGYTAYGGIFFFFFWEGGCLFKFNVFVTQGQTKHTHETAPTKEDSQLGISLHLTLVITFIAIIIISLQKS